MYLSVTRMHRDKEILKFCDVSVTLTKTPRAPDAGYQKKKEKKKAINRSKISKKTSLMYISIH